LSLPTHIENEGIKRLKLFCKFISLHCVSLSYFLVCNCEPVIVELVGRRFGGVVPQSQVRQI
jgi:hypothetical protein